MRRPRWLVAITVLCLGLTLAAALRLDDMRLKRGLAHDEAVSYLAAAGHEDSYAQASTSGLAGRWVTAAAWKHMLLPDGFWGFGRVTAGLVHLDNHPPLYFWALHLWVWLVGLHLWSGPLLNLAFTLLTAIAVFVLGRRVVGDTLFAALGAAIWACSFPVVVTSRMARQYDLLALLTVLFVLIALRFLDSDKEIALGDPIALALVTAACLLTHYEFTAFAAGSLVLFTCMLWRHRRRLLSVLAAMAAGILVAVLLNPRFYESFLRQRHQASHATLALFFQRVDAVRLALQSFFHYAVPGPVAAFVVKGRVHDGLVVCVIALLALLGVGATAVMPASQHRVRRLVARISRRTWGFLAFVGLAAATTVLTYLVFQVPDYAMGGRYLAMFWPLLALVVMLLLRSLGRSGRCDRRHLRCVDRRASRSPGCRAEASTLPSRELPGKRTCAGCEHRGRRTATAGPLAGTRRGHSLRRHVGFAAGGPGRLAAATFGGHLLRQCPRTCQVRPYVTSAAGPSK